MRGRLTKEVQTLAVCTMGRDITTTELHLMPYLQYVLMNSQKIEPIKINPEELEILTGWAKKEYITMSNDFKITIQKYFWDMINNILYQSYVLQEGTPIKEVTN